MMGDLAEEIRNEKKKPKNTYRIDEIIRSLTKADADDLMAALRDPGIANAAIVRVLKRRGHDISENGVRNYRKYLNVVE